MSLLRQFSEGKLVMFRKKSCCFQKECCEFSLSVPLSVFRRKSCWSLEQMLWVFFVSFFVSFRKEKLLIFGSKSRSSFRENVVDYLKQFYGVSLSVFRRKSCRFSIRNFVDFLKKCCEFSLSVFGRKVVDFQKEKLLILWRNVVSFLYQIFVSFQKEKLLILRRNVVSFFCQFLCQFSNGKVVDFQKEILAG